MACYEQKKSTIGKNLLDTLILKYQNNNLTVVTNS